MKKLMFAALGAAVTTGAFAAPLVYDYKASAKHMYAKEIKVKAAGRQWKVYQKYITSATLKGYLIVDTDGATSPVIAADTIAAKDPGGTRWFNATPPTSVVDHGRSRAYLVVMNTKAEKSVRAPKLLPAVLDAKWLCNKKFALDANNQRVLNKTGDAEGYLYVGGDFGAATRAKLDLLDAGVTTRGAAVNGQVMVGDYVWQSLWLFGAKNMPLVAGNAALNYDVVQAAIDANLPLSNGFAAGQPFFHDAWLNGAGFGKYTTLSDAGELCCGLEWDDAAMVLETLTGNLKGGLFLCTENGTVSDAAYSWLGVTEPWEDQFFCARLIPSADYAPDTDQTDLWQDGQLELNTTDCISGTWSIKRTTKLAPVALTQADLNIGLGLAVGANWTEDVPGLTDLLSTIKGAAVRLDRNVILANGAEIYNTPANTLGRIASGYAANTIPLMTPAFAAYYGFLNFR